MSNDDGDGAKAILGLLFIGFLLCCLIGTFALTVAAWRWAFSSPTPVAECRCAH